MNAPLAKERRRSGCNKDVSATPEDSLLLARAQAAQLLAIGLTHLDELIRAGRLTPVRLGRRVLLRRSSLLQFIADCEISRRDVSAQNGTRGDAA